MSIQVHQFSYSFAQTIMSDLKLFTHRARMLGDGHDRSFLSTHDNNMAHHDSSKLSLAVYSDLSFVPGRKVALPYYLVTQMQLFYYQCIVSLCSYYLISKTVVYENGRS